MLFILGLINTEDVNQVEICLTVAEDLIRSSPHGLQEVNLKQLSFFFHLFYLFFNTEILDNSLSIIITRVSQKLCNVLASLDAFAKVVIVMNYTGL